MILITGMPRSGTSLVEQVLDCHNSVCGAGELMEIGNAVAEIGFRVDAPVPSIEQFKSVGRDFLNRISEDYLAKLESLSLAEDRVTDKMPGNFMWLGLIQLLFPRARIIHTRRNPLDTCLSCYFTDFNGVHEYAYDLEDLGHYYCEYDRIMRHWHDVLDIQLLEVDYEELVTDLEGVSRRMLEFCELNWDAKVLDFHNSGRLANTASYLQVRNPIYTSSIGKWKRYDSHLAPLRSAIAACHHE